MDANQVKSSIDILQLIGADTTLKRVSSSGGGEYAGPCPMCGGEDRFRVQPNRPDGGKWYCRGCGENKWHDVIDYKMQHDHLDFVAALSALSGDQPGQLSRQEKKEAPEIKIDQDQWIRAARLFVDDCQKRLWDDPESAPGLDHLLGRGLTIDTLVAWRIGWNKVDRWGDPQAWGLPANEKPIFLPRGITIPCENELGFFYVKVRRGKTGNPKDRYHYLRHSIHWLYGAQTLKDFTISFLFESELDVLLAWQTGFKLGYASIPAGQNLRIEYGPHFTGVDDVIVAFDNDAEGNKAANELCKLSPRFYKADPVPAGKDLTEYYQSTGNRDNVFYYLYDQLGCIGVKHGS